MDNEKIKNFIIKSRQQGVPDDQILAFIKSKQAAPTVEQQKEQAIAEGKPTSVRSDRVEPTFLGSVLRSTLQAPIKTALSIPAAVMGEKGITVKSNYLGDTSDLSKTIRDNAEQLAERVKAGEITLPGALLRSTGKAGLETLEVGGLVPISSGAKTGTKLAQEGVKDIAQAGNELATGVSKLAETVTPKPEDIMNRVARLKPTDANKFKELSGKTHGQYLKETGNFGTPDEIVKKEAEKFVQSLNEVDNALASLPGTYKSGAIEDALIGLSEKAAATSSKNVKSPILKKVTEYQTKLANEGLTMSEINDVKRLYEKNVKLGYNKLMNQDKVEQATFIDNAVRKWQVEQAKKLGFENISELNKQTQLSKFIVDKLGNQILGKSGNDAVGLTDWIMVSGGDPTAIGGLLVKKFFSSENVQSKIAKMLTKEAPKGIKKAIVK